MEAGILWKNQAASILAESDAWSSVMGRDEKEAQGAGSDLGEERSRGKERASRTEVWMVPKATPSALQAWPCPCGLAPRGALDRNTQAAGFPCSRGVWSSCGGSLQRPYPPGACLVRTDSRLLGECLAFSFTQFSGRCRSRQTSCP